MDPRTRMRLRLPPPDTRSWKRTQLSRNEGFAEHDRLGISDPYRYLLEPKGRSSVPTSGVTSGEASLGIRLAMVESLAGGPDHIGEQSIKYGRSHDLSPQLYTATFPRNQVLSPSSYYQQFLFIYNFLQHHYQRANFLRKQSLVNSSL
jgi:hypothetical protein